MTQISFGSEQTVHNLLITTKFFLSVANKPYYEILCLVFRPILCLVSVELTSRVLLMELYNYIRLEVEGLKQRL